MYGKLKIPLLAASNLSGPNSNSIEPINAINVNVKK
jgi:hypothetical protein